MLSRNRVADTDCLHLNALASESLRSWLRDIACDATDLEVLGESSVGKNSPDNGASLVASGSEYGNELRHCD